MKNLHLKLNDEFKNFVVSRKETKDLYYQEKGVQYLIHFPNCYGASIIKKHGSYGYERDLWELSLLTNRDGTGKWTLEYTELVEYDVLGCLTDEQVNIVLKYIMEGDVNTDINIYGYDD